MVFGFITVKRWLGLYFLVAMMNHLPVEVVSCEGQSWVTVTSLPVVVKSIGKFLGVAGQGVWRDKTINTLKFTQLTKGIVRLLKNKIVVSSLSYLS